MPQKLTQEIIAAAIAGFEAQKQHIDVQIAELRSLLDGRLTTMTAGSEASPKPKRRISAASRRRMALAQEKRWAAIKGPSASALETTPERPKPRISPEGMKRIIAATKKRWALKRAEEAKASRPAAKRGSPVQKKAPAKKAAPAKAA
jgi:hypothetical protein